MKIIKILINNRLKTLPLANFSFLVAFMPVILSIACCIKLRRNIKIVR